MKEFCFLQFNGFRLDVHEKSSIASRKYAVSGDHWRTVNGSKTIKKCLYVVPFFFVYRYKSLSIEINSCFFDELDVYH